MRARFWYRKARPFLVSQNGPVGVSLGTVSGPEVGPNLDPILGPKGTGYRKPSGGHMFDGQGAGQRNPSQQVWAKRFWPFGRPWAAWPKRSIAAA